MLRVLSKKFSTLAKLPDLPYGYEELAPVISK